MRSSSPTVPIRRFAGGSAFQLFSRIADVPVGGLAGAVDLRQGAVVDPVVGDDAVAVGIGAGEDGRVAGASEGERVAVVRVAEPGALIQQAGEAAGAVLVTVLHQLLLRQAVDHQDQHQGGGVAAGPD